MSEPKPGNDPKTGDAPAPRPNGAPMKIELPLHRRVDTSFLQYASYVIRDRAIPNLADGLKPVQRRILWSLHEKDDGRFIKVATINGHCAQYHPHGEAAIGDALVVMTNKRYLIEGQGNYGNIYTNFDFKFSGGEYGDFHTVVNAKPGNGPRYSFESKYGNVYLRKAL
jgi:hypothetical protein